MRAIELFADNYSVFNPGEYILCAVSGGADSMCLLNLLLTLSKTRSFNLAVLHFNHKLRASESDRDELFVRSFCESLGIKFISDSADIYDYARKLSLSTELAARHARYAFFERSVKSELADYVTTAHTADDNAETIIFNLCRGSGLKGITGIPPVRGIFLRPLLKVPRSEIIDYLSNNGIEYVTDSSNLLPIYSRNKIRLSVIPLLKSINPALIQTISSVAELFSEDEDFLASLAADYLRNLLGSDSEVRLERSSLNQLHFSLASRVIRQSAGHLGVRLSHVLTKSILRLSSSDSASASIPLSDNLYAHLEYSTLIINRVKPELMDFKAITLNLGEWTEIKEIGMAFLLRVKEQNEKIYSSFNTFFFKKDAICGRITVRPRLAGDKIELLGRFGTRSLKKLFIDNKIPLRNRGRIPIVADSKQVVAIPGIGISAAHAASDDDFALVLQIRSC